MALIAEERDFAIENTKIVLKRWHINGTCIKLHVYLFPDLAIYFFRFKYKSHNLLFVNCIKVIERVFKKMNRKKEHGSA